MTYRVAGGGDAIAIGGRSYFRSTATGHWQASGGGFSFGWPEPFYRTFFQPTVAVRLLSDDGQTIQLAFARPDITAWFTVQIVARTHMLRTMQMLADGHLMNDRITSINPPVTIRPPPSATP